MPAYCWAVQVHRGVEIRNVQTFGAQDPYVVASLLWKQESLSSQRGPTAPGGGTEPSWESKPILLPSTQKPQSLLLEVWNENTAIDDRIGQARLDISSAASFARGKRVICTLDTSGIIEATVHCMLPLRASNIRPGQRVQRGPNWEEGNSDGGRTEFLQLEP